MNGLVELVMERQIIAQSAAAVEFQQAQLDSRGNRWDSGTKPVMWQKLPEKQLGKKPKQQMSEYNSTRLKCHH